MKFKRNKKRMFIILFLLVLSVTLGYAFLNSTLTINGTSKIKNAKWIIYFDRLQNESGVHSNNTNINDKKDTVSFDILIENPGDYYEFDVDTVNDGTIDAIIDSVELTGIPDELQDILTFDVVYKGTNTKVSRCDMLEKNSRKNITVKLTYSKYLEEEDLITEETDLELKFKINYVQEAVCDNNTPTADPRLTINPNGGIYNETTEPTTITLEKNVETEIDPPTREGYTFKYYTLNNVGLGKETNGKTKLSITEDTTIIAEWEEVIPTTTYTVTINPNGGIYNNKTENTVLTKTEGETVELSKPTKEGYVFSGWEEVTETTALAGSIITVGTANIEVKAKWASMDDMVAKIIDQETNEDKFYPTIQSAFDDAITNDKVWLLKSTTEDATNVKNISFDLGGFKVTGTITNNGTLTIDNGTIEDITKVPVINNGTINVGTKDATMVPDSIVIFGGGLVNGLEQNGTFNFYDGYIEGKIAVTGPYNELAEGYYYIVDHDEINNCQKAYLSPEIDAIVKINMGNPIYFKLLQDAIDVSVNRTDNDRNIYAIKNFETSHDVTIAENQEVIFDITGYTILEGAQITNNGNFTIIDRSEEKGTFNPSLPIKNNGTLNIINTKLAQATTNGNLIENSGNLNITNSTLTAQNGYALDIKAGGNLVFDNETTITANNYGIYNEAQEAVTVTGGKIVGIYNNGLLTVNNSNVLAKTDKQYSYAIYNNSGSIYLNNLNLEVNSTQSYGIGEGTASTLVKITGGTYSTVSTYYELISAANGTTEIEGATITGSSSRGLIISNSKLELTDTTINATGSGICINKVGGEVTINSGNYTSESYAVTTNYYGTNLNIKAGTFTSNSTTINTSCATNITGGTFASNNSNAINTGSNYATTNITGGTFISNKSSAMYKNSGNSTTTITGGTFKGKTYGVEISNENTGTMIFGSNDNNITNETPIMIGELFGIYIPIGKTIQFYDGIIYGKSDAYYGNITKTPKKYEMIKENRTLEDEDYIASYLQAQKDFLEVNGTRYNSIQDAIDVIEETGTIKIIDKVTIGEQATIPAGKTITLDLNGNSIVNYEKLINNGILTLKDGTSAKEGLLSSINSSLPLLVNNNKLIIKSGNYESIQKLIESNNSELVIEDGNFEAKEIITGNCKATISGGNFTGKNNNQALLYLYGNNVSITGGTFKNLGSSSAVSINNYILETGGVSITGGEFIGTSGPGLTISGTATISDVNITSESGAALYIRGKATLNNVTSTSTNYYAMMIDSQHEVIVNSGNYTSINSSALYYNGSNTKILGGTFQGKNDGLYIPSTGSLIIGNDDDNVTSENPVFIGENNGAYISNGTVQFYDGIFKGKTNAHNGNISTFADGYVIEYGEEGEYKTATLAQQPNFLRVGNKEFSSLQAAIDEISTTGTIEVIKEGLISKTVTIGSEKNITIDLNGYTIGTSNSIINNGILTLKDSSEPSEGLLYNNGSSKFIKNNGTLKIESGEYKCISGVYGNYLINQSEKDDSLLEITGGTFKNEANNYIIYKSKGTIQIDDGYFYSSTSTDLVKSTGSGKLTINGGTFETKGIAIIISSPAEINGGLFKANSWGMQVESGYEFNFKGGLIDSSNGIQFNNSSNNKITGGTIKGNSGYGVYSYYASLDIGTNDSSINIAKPIIEGKTYGVYSTSVVVNFYDGILKGQTHAYASSEFASFATNSTLHIDSETENDITKEVAYLVTLTDILRNETTGTIYNDLQTALTTASSGDTLTVLDNIASYNEITVPDKTLTIETDGHEISFLKNVVNEGNLTIVDNNGNISGTISIKSGTNITTNNKLSLNNLEISLIGSSSADDIIKNNGELSLKNINISKVGRLLTTSTGSTTTIEDSNISTETNGITNKGELSLIRTNMDAEYYTAVYNYGKLTIDGGQYNNRTNGLSANPVIYSGTESNGVYNLEDENIIKNITITSETAIENRGNNIKLTNSTITGSIYNNEGSLFDISNTSIKSNTRNSNLIGNSGTMVITDKSATIECSMTVISNAGTLTLNNFNIKNNSVSSISSATGIENSGSLDCNKVNIEFSNINTQYGINNKGGNLNYLDGKIELNSANTAYGIYQTGGSITIGKLEEPLSVSTTTPLIKAIATATGIGVKKTNGTFNYYDGKIIGSTQAKPEAPTSLAGERYRVKTVQDTETNTEYCFLEYVE